MIEQSRTERGGNNDITRKEAWETIQGLIRIDEAEKRREKLARKNRDKYGSNKDRDQGIDDRINGRQYDDTKYITKDDKQSYRYGYYDAGNMAIFILISSGKYEGRIAKIIPEDMEDLEEKIAKIAENDGMNPEIEFEKLLKAIKDNQTYCEYYNASYLNRNKISR